MSRLSRFLLPQGVTFRVERGELVIARILHGGMIDQQGLLHVGDIIKEVNGQEVGCDPRALQEMLKNASGSVVLKILPSYQEPHPARQVGFSPNRSYCIPSKYCVADLVLSLRVGAKVECIQL